MAQPNDRIFYACQGVAIQNHGYADDVTTSEMIHGLQSVGVTTNFSLEQAFELGQIQIYENIEGLPDVECTMERCLTAIHCSITWPHRLPPAPDWLVEVSKGQT